MPRMPRSQTACQPSSTWNTGSSGSGDRDTPEIFEAVGTAVIYGLGVLFLYVELRMVHAEMSAGTWIGSMVDVLPIAVQFTSHHARSSLWQLKSDWPWTRHQTRVLIADQQSERRAIMWWLCKPVR